MAWKQLLFFSIASISINSNAIGNRLSGEWITNSERYPTKIIINLGGHATIGNQDCNWIAPKSALRVNGDPVLLANIDLPANTFSDITHIEIDCKGKKIFRFFIYLGKAAGADFGLTYQKEVPCKWPIPTCNGTYMHTYNHVQHYQRPQTTKEENRSDW